MAAAKKQPRGSKHHNASLREFDIICIRQRRKNGETVKDIAADYGLSMPACSNICNGNTWKHVKDNMGMSILYEQEYHIWNSMLQRCENPKHVSYPSYGGRGVKVCEQWHNFQLFLQDMGTRPSKGHSLDRIDPHKGYEPGNVKWATVKEQSRNKRNTVMMPHPDTGEKVPASQLAEEAGMSYNSFRTLMIREGKWPTKQSNTEE